MSEYKRIWEAYQLYAKTATVRRKGFELCGMTFPTANETLDFGESFAVRGESDLEHQAKVAWLLLAFTGGENFLRDYFLSAILNRDGIGLWSLFAVALCHDIGEVETGDIPDDGNALHETKDETERRVFEEMSEIYSPEYFRREIARATFRCFQEKENNFGMLLFTLDKLEAVLMQLLCEKYGCLGKTTAKPYATELDNYYMRETGSESSADCWAAHMCSLIRDFPEWIKEPVSGLLDAAVRDVRGEPFAWWNKDILPYKEE